jgi:hypothetical protein
MSEREALAREWNEAFGGQFTDGGIDGSGYAESGVLTAADVQRWLERRGIKGYRAVVVGNNIELEPNWSVPLNIGVSIHKVSE